MMDASQGLEREDKLGICKEQRGNKCSAFSISKQWSASGRERLGTGSPCEAPAGCLATGCQSKEMRWKNCSFLTLHQSRLKNEVGISWEAALACVRLQTWAFIALWWRDGLRRRAVCWAAALRRCLLGASRSPCSLCRGAFASPPAM